MQQEIQLKNRRWMNIIQPTVTEITDLRKRFHFHELDLEDCLSESQRSKIDEYEKYLFIILHFPHHNGGKAGRLETTQLNIFVGKHFMITVHQGEIPKLNTLFERCQKSQKKKEFYFGRNSGYLLYQIIHALFADLFPITDEIQRSLKKIEHEIFEPAHPKDQLRELMLMKKNIITLRKIILPERSVVAALEYKQERFLGGELELYFDEIVDQIERLWNILETQKEIIQSLEDTNESLLSHNINFTIRTLTVFSAIMLPLTFLTGLFGMNIKLPFKDPEMAMDSFWGVLIGMGVVALLLFGFFKWKKWI